MVIEIALGIVVAYLIIFFALPVIWAVICGVFGGLFETLGEILSDVYGIAKNAFKPFLAIYKKIDKWVKNPPKKDYESI